MERYFVTGIGTDVGKTVVSALMVQALGADYWKPVQAGDLDYADLDRVKALVHRSDVVYFQPIYALNTPMSPHAAADIDGVQIDLKQIKRPESKKDLVIEGAGGLMVPLNKKDLIVDLIHPSDKIVLVSRNYLGSINHTLLSIALLRSRGFQNIGLLFNGASTPTTEKIIEEMTGVKVLGRLPELSDLNQEVIREQAERLRENLKKF